MSNNLLKISECGKKIMLLCLEIHPRFKEYCVLTTSKEVKETIDNYRKSDKGHIKFVYRESLLNILQYSDEELNNKYTLNSKEWKDWCDDILIFYAVRLLLFDKPIPIYRNFCRICKKSESETKLRKCSICEVVYYCSAECQKSDWISHKQTCCPCR
jgi:hypothetical protein